MSEKKLLCGCSFDGYEFKPCSEHAVDRIRDDLFNKLADDLEDVDRKYGVTYDYSKLRERKAPWFEEEKKTEAA